MGNEVEIIDRCIICAASVAQNDQRFADNLGLTADYGVKRCAGCGLRWLSPRPTERVYRLLYRDEYLDTDSSVEQYDKLADERRPYFRNRIRTIEQMADACHLDILEIGAATGEFVYEAKRRGHCALGLELSEYARSEARKKYDVELVDQPLESLAGGGFDVIHMNHVFEHILSPAECLDNCGRLLKSNGLLVLEVPQQFDNDLDRLKKILRMNRTPSFNAYSLHHAYFYTPESLQKLLEKHGYRILRMRTANSDRTPLWPINYKNLVLRPYLWLSDQLHRGGNIIEVYARVNC